MSATDTFDWSNLDVDQLADGTVMLSYVRAAADGGEEPVFAVVNPDVDPVDAGFVVQSNVEIQSADDTAIESPPVTTVLENGNVLFIWSENAALDDTTTMILRGRIYDPTSQTWMTADFRIGTQAIDGSAFDNDNLTVTQLTGGNIVVGYVRSNAESGFAEPAYTVLNPAGNVVRALSEIEGQDTETQATALESPPLIVALDDGRWMAVWANDGLSDDVATTRLEGRIFNGDGTPATNDFPISRNAVEGFDGYDNANFTAVTLSNGNVVIGYAESDVTSGDGSNLPHFTIVSGFDGSQIVIDRAIAQSPDHIWGGPPVIAALGGGHFVAVFADGNQASGGVTGLTYRIFDANGRP